MFTKDQLITFETNIKELFEEGKINCPVHLSGGNEDALLEIFTDIAPTDYVLSTHRNHYHYLLHTGNDRGLYDEILGLSTGICKGQSRSMHIIDHNHRFYSSGIVAGLVSTAVGIAMGLQLEGRHEEVYCFVGDGATDEGWFWEAARYANGYSLPVTFVVENNNRSVCTNLDIRWGLWDNLEHLLRELSLNVLYYEYEATYPHVGTGKHITFM